MTKILQSFINYVSSKYITFSLSYSPGHCLQLFSSTPFSSSGFMPDIQPQSLQHCLLQKIWNFGPSRTNSNNSFTVTTQPWRNSSGARISLVELCCLLITERRFKHGSTLSPTIPSKMADRYKWSKPSHCKQYHLLDFWGLFINMETDSGTPK